MGNRGVLTEFMHFFEHKLHIQLGESGEIPVLFCDFSVLHNTQNADDQQCDAEGKNEIIFVIYEQIAQNQNSAKDAVKNGNVLPDFHFLFKIHTLILQIREIKNFLNG